MNGVFFFGEHLMGCKGRASTLPTQLYSHQSMWRNVALAVGEGQQVSQLQTWTLDKRNGTLEV